MMIKHLAIPVKEMASALRLARGGVKAPRAGPALSTLYLSPPVKRKTPAVVAGVSVFVVALAPRAVVKAGGRAREESTDSIVTLLVYR
jgi:hypothetical protein